MLILTILIISLGLLCGMVFHHYCKEEVRNGITNIILVERILGFLLLGIVGWHHWWLFTLGILLFWNFSYGLYLIGGVSLILAPFYGSLVLCMIGIPVGLRILPKNRNWEGIKFIGILIFSTTISHFVF